LAPGRQALAAGQTLTFEKIKVAGINFTAMAAYAQLRVGHSPTAQQVMAWTKSALNASFLITLCVLYIGCHAKIPHTQKAPTAEETWVESGGASSSPSERGNAKSKEWTEPKHPIISEDKKRDQKKQAPLGPKSDKGSEKKATGDEAGTVQEAALDLAKTLDNIKKAKVCYSSKGKEWWVVFYQEINSAVEVKQFFWNPDSEKFEPFLVLKRIPRAKMDSDFKKDEPEKKCTVLTLPTGK
jgi:hypothetical protein